MPGTVILQHRHPVQVWHDGGGSPKARGIPAVSVRVARTRPLHHRRGDDVLPVPARERVARLSM